MTDQPAHHDVDDLGRCIREVAEFLAEDTEWGAPPQMFALVPTALLAESDPALLDRLDESGLTPVEQDPLYDDADLHPAALGEILSDLSWPESVAGCLLVREIVVLPPGSDPDPGMATHNPQRRDARLFAAVTRNGHGLCLLQMREPEPSPDAEGDADGVAAEADAGSAPHADPFSEVQLLRYEGLGEDLLDGLRATFDEADDS
ncbi:MAG: PPA1309 family protein [Tomitella sp.]|nr:PPA1309 family protein [Tomitella sp.]